MIGDAALFDELRGGPATGYGPDIPDFGGQLSALTYDHGSTFKKLNPGAFAAKELVLTMHGAGIGARPLNRTLPAPAGAQELASVQSPPLSVMLKLMDVPSDDFFAEMLTKQLGVRFGERREHQRRREGDLAGDRLVRRAPVDRRRLGPVARRIAPRPIRSSTLLRTMWNTPIGRVLSNSLPVVGVNGTVQRNRRPHRRSGPLHRQDRHAQLRHQPRRLLHDPLSTTCSRSR